MRIVFDTHSRGWAVFKNWFVGLFILFLILIISAIIEGSTGYDSSFETGFISAYHIFKYNWKSWQIG